jgi:hypothetical protein
MIQELDVLKKNISDLQRQLQDAYTRIGQLNDLIYDQRRVKSDEQLAHEDKIFNTQIHPKDQS